jgi:hypothetical protein
MKKDIQKLFIRAAILLLPLFAYYVCYEQYLIWKRDFKVDAITVYKAIDKSKQKVKKKKIIFGDSVGAQLYPNSNDGGKDFYSLTTSAPSSLIGIYVLLQNFLAANPSDDSLEFYYVVHPSSLDEHLRGKYTYNHFVKPFYTWGNMPYFSQSVRDSIHTIPYWYAAQLPFIKITDWQPVFNFIPDKDYRNTISPLYIKYLKKIDSLARERHFKFIAVTPILRETNRNADYSKIQQLINENGLQDIFRDYFSHSQYAPLDKFHTGSNHYLHPEEFGDNPLGI